MKQIIVLASMIALGLFISSVVLGFEDDVEAVGDSAGTAIVKLTENLKS